MHLSDMHKDTKYSPTLQKLSYSNNKPFRGLDTSIEVFSTERAKGSNLPWARTRWASNNGITKKHNSSIANKLIKTHWGINRSSCTKNHHKEAAIQASFYQKQLLLQCLRESISLRAAHNFILPLSLPS